MVRRISIYGLASLACWLPAGVVGQTAGPPRSGQPELTLEIETPTRAQVLGDVGKMVFVAGRVLGRRVVPTDAFDIVFVIDRSRSTASPSGEDIDQDGTVGASLSGPLPGMISLPPSSDPGDTVLQAELAAVGALIDQLDWGRSRVALVTFSGDGDPNTSDAEVELPLTADGAEVRAALSRIGLREPEGLTNMVAGLDAAARELLGAPGSRSARRTDAQKIVLFMTDGEPTLPFEGPSEENRRLAIAAASRIARSGIRIDTFAIGRPARERETTIVEMALVSGGVFTPVTDPGDLSSAFRRVNLSRVEAVGVRNLRTGEAAAYLSLGADGSYAALLPVAEGLNVVEVYAHATDGTQASQSVSFQFESAAAAPVLRPALRTARNHLLELRLDHLQRRSLELGEQQDANIRRQIVEEIERAREDAIRGVRVETEEP